MKEIMANEYAQWQLSKIMAKEKLSAGIAGGWQLSMKSSNAAYSA
jgi:hypothetical protein